jgi:ligand-binding sensor domain-containing protein
MNNEKTLATAKNYKTNPKFNSMCAAMNGKFAVGSEDGVVRLYRELGKNSLNNFYTLSKNRITMIDCTKDGKYMLVTTD